MCLVLARPKCAWQGLIKEKIDARSVSVAMPRYSGEPTGSGQCPCRQAVKLSPGA